MFATDTALQRRANRASLLCSHADQRANALLVEYLERIHLQDLLVQIDREEGGDVVTRITEGHLRQVVRTKREELGRRSDAVSGQRSTRHLDHRTHEEVDPFATLSEECLSFGTDYGFLLLELVEDTRQRHHDLRMGLHTFLLQIECGTEDSARLHLRNLRIGVAQTTSAVTEHRVLLVECFHTLTDVCEAHAHRFSHLLLPLLIVRHKLMQRWIEQANRHGITCHHAQDTFEVVLLIRQDLRQCLLPILCIFSQDHLAHGFDLFSLEEHVLRTAKANTYGAKVACALCIVWRIGVGAHLETGVLVCQRHQIGKVA